jgi:adenylyltransferase/sulfurtransferase
VRLPKLAGFLVYDQKGEACGERMTDQDRERYSRQILFPELGESGQQRLLDSRAVIVGCGALGSFQAAALARAGVGHLVIIDRDYVEPSNLQRQWLFEEADATEGLPKAIAAKKHLARVNAGVSVDAEVADLTPRNAERLLLPADVILDGTDNFETRYLINDAAVKHGVPWVYGAAVGSCGLTMPVLPTETACLACLFPAPPGGVQPTCDTAGILNTAAAVVASLQAADAIKILAGRRDSVHPRLLSLDVWKDTMRSVSTGERDPNCTVCGRSIFSYLEAAGRRPLTLCGRNAVQVHERDQPLDLEQLRSALEPLGQVRANPFVLRFLCPPYEMTIFPDGRAIIKGTEDPGVARSLYARYIGS